MDATFIQALKSMRTIIIVRNKGWYCRFRTVSIMADNTELSRLKPGSTTTLTIPMDVKYLYIKTDFLKSLKYIAKNIKNGQTIYANSWFTFNILKNFGISSIPFELEDHPR